MQNRYPLSPERVTVGDENEPLESEANRPEIQRPSIYLFDLNFVGALGADRSYFLAVIGKNK